MKQTCVKNSTKRKRKKTPKSIIHDAISTGSCVAAGFAWWTGFIIEGLFITNIGKFMMCCGGGYVLLWTFANFFYPKKNERKRGRNYANG